MPLDIALLLEDMTASWLKWMALIGGTLGVVGAGLQLMDRLVPVLKWIQRRILNPVWNGPLKPLAKLFIAIASIVIPNGFFIGWWTFYIGGYYYQLGMADYIVTNPAVFWQLLAWQTALVSIYSFFWAIFLYPRIKAWFVFWKKSS